MSVVHQTDQVDQATALLLTQFQDKPTIVALLASYTKQAQILEDVGNDMLTKRGLSTATGEQLDGIGRIVMLVRDGRDDETYRAGLAIQIKILRNSGTFQEITDITFGLVADTYQLLIIDGPTSVDIFASSDVGDTPTPLAIAKQLRRFIAAGVRAMIHWDDFFGVGGRTAPLSFGPSNDMDGLSAGLGNAAGTTGGYFIRASDGEDPGTLV